MNKEWEDILSNDLDKDINADLSPKEIESFVTSIAPKFWSQRKLDRFIFDFVRMNASKDYMRSVININSPRNYLTGDALTEIPQEFLELPHLKIENCDNLLELPAELKVRVLILLGESNLLSMHPETEIDNIVLNPNPTRYTREGYYDDRFLQLDKSQIDKLNELGLLFKLINQVLSKEFILEKSIRVSDVGFNFEKYVDSALNIAKFLDQNKEDLMNRGIDFQSLRDSIYNSPVINEELDIPNQVVVERLSIMEKFTGFFRRVVA